MGYKEIDENILQSPHPDRNNHSWSEDGSLEPPYDYKWDTQYMPRRARNKTGKGMYGKGDFLTKEEAVNEYFGNRNVCRRGKLKNKHKYKIISPLPTNLHTNMSLDNVCEDAVNLINDNSNGRKINLLWSGGIDSTVALYAFARTDIPINVHYDVSAEQECPTGWDALESGRYSNITSINHGYVNERFALRTPLIPYVKDTGNIFVTGEIGDNIMGSARVFLYPKEVRNDHFSKVIPDWVAEILHQSVMCALNKKDVSLKQWTWAWCFMVKYQYCQVRCHEQYNIAPYPPLSNAFHFFDTPNFQRWAVTNQDEINSWQEIPEYKMTLKQFIYEQNGDKYWRDNKLKTPSSNRRRVQGGFNFEDQVTGLELNEEYIRVIKKTFGANTPEVKGFSREDRKNMY